MGTQVLREEEDIMNCDWCGKELGERNVTITVRDRGVVVSRLAMHFECFYEHFEKEEECTESSLKRKMP